MKRYLIEWNDESREAEVLEAYSAREDDDAWEFWIPSADPSSYPHHRRTTYRAEKSDVRAVEKLRKPKD